MASSSYQFKLPQAPFLHKLCSSCLLLLKRGDGHRRRQNQLLMSTHFLLLNTCWLFGVVMHDKGKQLHFLWCTLEYTSLCCLTRGKTEQIDWKRLSWAADLIQDNAASGRKILKMLIKHEYVSCKSVVTLVTFSPPPLTSPWSSPMKASVKTTAHHICSHGPSPDDDDNDDDNDDDDTCDHFLSMKSLIILVKFMLVNANATVGGTAWPPILRTGTPHPRLCRSLERHVCYCHRRCHSSAADNDYI
jgi:hypothetical protein